ncbi:MAG TPA: hypothetical protein VGD78_07050 [Chthoniobacterales bacterium]
MTIKRLTQLSRDLAPRVMASSGIPPDQAEAAARQCASVGPEWVTLTVRCLFEEAHFGAASGADLLLEHQDGPNGPLQYRTVAVDFLHHRVDFDLLLED